MKSNSTKVLGLWTDWNRKGAEGQYGGIGWYRIINPLSKIDGVTTQGQITLGSDKRIEVMKEIGEKAEVLITKYVDSFVAVNHLLTIRDILGIKLFVDIDDNVFEVHPHNYAYREVNKDTEACKAFAYLFKEADGLICSTQPLADYMKAYNKNITVIENSIDKEIWNVPLKKNKSGKVKIGWVYGPTHEQDINVFVPVVKELLKKYKNIEFHHIGWQSEVFERMERQKMTFGTSGYKEFPTFLASQGMDILVAPLIEDEFNRGKSNIKWMEGAMCEVPMVCSDVYPYSVSITQGKDGFLAKTTSDWIKHLSTLIEDKKLRVNMGKEAKKTVLKNHLVEKAIPKYKKLIEDAVKPEETDVTVVVTSRKGEDDSLAIDTLNRQTYKGLQCIRIEDVDGKGQNWAKNEGLRQVKTKYVLFSDNDIKWKLDAVKSLRRVLEDNPDVSYSFGAYIWNVEGFDEKHIQCNEKWTADRLKDFAKGNMVSTMSMVRTKDCPIMDETIRRLTDWDLWLTMLPKTGKHCEKVIFETIFTKKGVSASGRDKFDKALEVLKVKHKTL